MDPHMIIGIIVLSLVVLWFSSRFILSLVIRFVIASGPFFIVLYGLVLAAGFALFVAFPFVCGFMNWDYVEILQHYTR